jgi:hypothetical protein
MNRQDRALKDTSSPANDSPLTTQVTTQAKALALNLDPATYGGSTEIGAGQEVVRCDTTTFFAFAERGLPGHHGADRKDPSASGSPLSSPASSLSGLGLVLTRSMRMKEGHPAYRSQSDNPLQGTTLGGRTDDPRREHTRDAAAGDPPRKRDRAERGVSGSRDLAEPVLSLGEAFGAVWRGRAASSTARRPAGACAAALASGRAADPRGANVVRIDAAVRRAGWFN